MFFNFLNYLLTQFIVGSLYYLTSLFTPFEARELPLTSVDLFFKPHFLAVWIYMSFFGLLIAGITFTTKEKSREAMEIVISNSIIASFFFVFFPTVIDYWDYAPYIDMHSISYQFMIYIKENDNTTNCFPSLHISNSIIGAYYLAQDKKNYLKLISWTWLILIVWSVISTKQHNIYDVVGGAILSLTSMMAHKFFSDRKNKKMAL